MEVRLAALLGALAVVLSSGGCGERDLHPDGDERADAALAGSIRVDGSVTTAPLTAAVARRFVAGHPNVHISIDRSGTDRGFARFCRGEIDVAHAAEAIDADAIKACERGGVRWSRVTVANDAVVLIVHPHNPIRCLTTDQLAQIWRGNSYVTGRWSQVGGTVPAYDEALIAWGPGTETETFSYFTLAVNRERGITRDYNNALRKNRSTIESVAGTPGAIGYAGYPLYRRTPGPVRLLAVDSGDGCVAPSPGTIADGSFKPFSRRLFVYVSTEALARPEVDAFLRSYLENAELAARQAGFVALTHEQLVASKANLERLIASAGGARSDKSG